ncbi:MAG: hypothetical protein WAX89_00170 [Alphaproteobacteria bacterium]
MSTSLPTIYTSTVIVYRGLLKLAESAKPQLTADPKHQKWCASMAEKILPFKLAMDAAMENKDSLATKAGKEGLKAQSHFGTIAKTDWAWAGDDGIAVHNNALVVAKAKL